MEKRPRGARAPSVYILGQLMYMNMLLSSHDIIIVSIAMFLPAALAPFQMSPATMEYEAPKFLNKLVVLRISPPFAH